MNVSLQVLTQLYKVHLENNLVGVYLHGSLAMDCFQEQTSDIDILVVVKNTLTDYTKKQLIADILKVEPMLPGTGIEMSILYEQTLQDFTHPTPFVLHYSPAYREKYLHDPSYLCADDVDPDLAAHIYVTYHRGVCLYGKPIKDVLKPIETVYYFDSILQDVQQAPREIIHKPIDMTLNLCRVLYFLKEHIVSSKLEAGEWAVNHVSSAYKELVILATEQYKGQKATYQYCLEPLLVSFAKEMLTQIKHHCSKEYFC